MERTWAGTHTFSAEAIHDARSIDEVQDLVAGNSRVRALGTRHSFNDLADGPGILVSTTQIDPDFVLDETAGTVTLGGGTRYGVLAEWLESRGWALHNMGSLPHISVAGATATSTHGSGDRNGSLSTAVSALQFITASGEPLTVRRGDPGFDGMVVHLGAFGIVTRVTLDVEPTYLVRQDVYDDVPWHALLGDFDAISSAGYSVSVFMNWVGPTLRSVWVKSRLDAGFDSDQYRIPDQLFGGRRDPQSKGVIDPVDDNVTQQGGVAGPWSQRLPHFRLDRAPSNGDEIQTEYFVDRKDATAALSAIREFGGLIAPHLLITELRTVAADELWLSPAYHRDALGIHFTWMNRPDQVHALIPRIEAALAPFAPRPHWGKVTHVMDAAAQYERAADFRALAARLDPEGKFRNEYLERAGL
jgi:xylitol oxidase